MQSGEAAGEIMAWDVASHRELLRYSRLVKVLAFSPDGSLIADGDGQGRIEVRDVSSGHRVAPLFSKACEIMCLAPARDPHSNARGGDHGWLVATGGSGGTLVIWDLSRQAIRSFCQGSPHFVSALAFSPDASLLASGGGSRVPGLGRGHR